MQYARVVNPNDIFKPDAGVKLAPGDAFAELGRFMEKTITGMAGGGSDSFSLEFQDGAVIAFISNPAPARIVFYVRDSGAIPPNYEG
jgi:hypothetical protein